MILIRVETGTPSTPASLRALIYILKGSRISGSSVAIVPYLNSGMKGLAEELSEVYLSTSLGPLAGNHYLLTSWGTWYKNPNSTGGWLASQWMMLSQSKISHPFEMKYLHFQLILPI